MYYTRHTHAVADKLCSSHIASNHAYTLLSQYEYFYIAITIVNFVSIYQCMVHHAHLWYSSAGSLVHVNTFSTQNLLKDICTYPYLHIFRCTPTAIPFCSDSCELAARLSASAETKESFSSSSEK